MGEQSLAKQLPKDYWKTIVFTFCLGWVVIWIYRSMLSPIYSEIQGTVGQHSNTALGLIASCYFFGYTSLQIPSGFLVDRFGQKKVLIPGFLLFAIGAFSIAMSRSLNTIYIGSVCAGIGCGTYYGAAFSLTAEHVPPEKKGIATAIVNSGSALGLILGMTGSSFIVKTLHLPWQTMVTISGSLIVLLVIWFAIAIKDRGRHLDIQKERIGKTEDSGSESGSEEKASLLSLNMISCYILYFSTCYAYYLIVTWLPKFLESERGITGGMIGLVVSMISVTAVPGALFFAGLSDKLRGKKALIIVSLELSAFVLVALSMSMPNALSLTIILLLYGFLGKMAVDPVLISYVSDRANKKNMATTLGLFNFFGMSSSIIAPAVTGFIIDKTGSGTAGFYIGALLLILGTILFLIFNARTFFSKAK
ncbi:MFS transporter [Lacrimispora celerecrescens]|uniref:Sugar phosphate permease n=1 Tax=[Clostridium] celerecrescens 18A TaxID=1286362 RepID=A0A2M8Z6N5_9FIRM|nr:MFS transporter [Lacrimispora celerecrescens]PJJ29099.1 sugar phosphate permease [[Clostridium] celerecrescens 18A]